MLRKTSRTKQPLLPPDPQINFGANTNDELKILIAEYGRMIHCAATSWLPDTDTCVADLIRYADRVKNLANQIGAGHGNRRT